MEKGKVERVRCEWGRCTEPPDRRLDFFVDGKIRMVCPKHAGELLRTLFWDDKLVESTSVLWRFWQWQIQDCVAEAEAFRRDFESEPHQVSEPCKCGTCDRCTFYDRRGRGGVTKKA